jgi:hypothetical protein
MLVFVLSITFNNSCMKTGSFRNLEPKEIKKKVGMQNNYTSTSCYCYENLTSIAAEEITTNQI